MFDPIKASEKIKNEFMDYLSTDFRFRDQNLQCQFKEQLDKCISKGPYLEINDVFKTSKSISDLIDEGLLSPRFYDIEKGKDDNEKTLPLERKLYVHQEEAIRQIVNGNNVVVSTGTGSGKTNCFLIPVINELLREMEKGNGELTPGVRAIFIFPMNALANDQMKNIRHLLKNYPQITFGVYNGETEEEEKYAKDLYTSMFAEDPDPDLRKPLPNELISRDEMKKNPPHILFTNYAMLEYLLFRPGDDVLFSQSDFKFIVLDEAHVYSGATGIETSMLLRRLKARINKHPQFILTSATLGGTDEEIVQFAKNISGEEFSTSNIIRGTRETQEFDKYNLEDYPKELFIDLADESNTVKEVLIKYKIPYDDSDDEEGILYDLLMGSKLYYELRGEKNQIYLTEEDEQQGKLTDFTSLTKRSGVFTLDEIKGRLKVDDDDTLVAFISLCTRAKKGKKALLDARYHYFIRTLEGCYITLPLNDQSTLSLTTSETLEGTNQRMFEIAPCNDCGAIAIVGKTIDGYLRNTKKYEEKAEYYVLADQFNDAIDDEESKDDNNKNTQDDYYLCPQCGRITKGQDHIDCNCHVPHIHLKNAFITKSGEVKCSSCHNGLHKRVYIGNEGATSTLATSLFEALPTTTTKVELKESVSDNPFFSSNNNKKVETISHDGQFIAFSDSRQDAAKFSWYLSESYKDFLRRRGICHLVERAQNDGNFKPKTISEYVGDLKSYFDTTGCFNDGSYESVPPNNERNAWIAMLNELARYRRGNSLTSLGYLQFRYKGIDELKNRNVIKTYANKYAVSEKAVEDLLNLLFLDIINAGAVKPDHEEDLSDDDRAYIFHSKKQKYISKESMADENIINWLPVKKKSGRYFKSNKMYYVRTVFGLPDDVSGDIKAYDFLENFWDFLTANQENINRYPLRYDPKGKAYYLPAKYIDVYIAGSDKLKWYKCPKCGKVQTYLCNDRCSVVKCSHKVDEVNPIDLRKDNHFAKLYEVEKMSPLVAKEHTAQLNKKESLRYQEDFIRKKINVLSCSTTFEMGVDIGDLEAVFLRDIPPTPSNYNQRAGRAGRSLDSAAYVLTFAKLSSHDMYFFNDPELMIKGEIMAPSFKLENEKIAKRHLYATVLSSFLREKPSIYDNNNADVFLNQNGYEVFCDWLKEKRITDDEDLKNELKSSIPGDNDFHNVLGLNNYGWIDEFIGEDGILSNLIRTYESNREDFETIIQNIKDDNTLSEADRDNKVARYRNSETRYMRNELIDFLAKGNILPRYGFPVNTVELEQNETTSTEHKLNLTRDLQLAIGDYAPSSEVVANGLMYTSRYIKKSYNDMKYGWKIAYIAKCPHSDCQATNFSVTPVVSDVKCISCGRPIKPMFFVKSIEPVAGFITEQTPKRIPMNAQERNYTAPIYYIGDVDAKRIDKKEIQFGSINVTIESTANDSLLVQSRNQFYVCEECGYSEAIKDIADGISKISDTHHTNSHGFTCNSNHMERYYLHHTFKTDVAKISFDGISTSDISTMLSTMYAIYNAMISVLNIDSKDLYVCLLPSVDLHTISNSIIVFDRIPGGSGYSRKLAEDNGETFRKIIQVAYDNMAKCDCDPSCYKCLRSYENRNYHDDLDRKKAMAFLEQFINQ